MARSGSETSVTIASGATASSSFGTMAYVKGSVFLAAAFTGDIVFQVSNDGTNWATVRSDDAGTAMSVIDVTAAVVLPIPIRCFSSKTTRILSDQAEAAERTIKVVLSD